MPLNRFMSDFFPQCSLRLVQKNFCHSRIQFQTMCLQEGSSFQVFRNMSSPALTAQVTKLLKTSSIMF